MVAYVIGLGSMGRRRIRLLLENEGVTVVGIDTNPDRQAAAQAQFGIKTFGSIPAAAAVVRGDCAFVCTSPLSHAAIIHTCLSNDLHVFTEINLVADGYEENMALAEERGRVLFLSSTSIYKAEQRHIIRRVEESRTPLNYIYHVGQYLPDWHPWESYRDFFVGDSRTNGCREIFAIELPWIVTAFGPVEDVSVLKSKNSGLDIQYDDNYLVQFRHRSGAKGVFAVDVVTRKAVRRLEVYGEDLYLNWDGNAGLLTEYDIAAGKENQVILESAEHAEGYAAFITENPYREEIKAFFEQVRHPEAPCKWDFRRDLDVLRVINRIEGLDYE